MITQQQCIQKIGKKKIDSCEKATQKCWIKIKWREREKDRQASIIWFTHFGYFQKESFFCSATSVQTLVCMYPYLTSSTNVWNK